MTVDEIMELEFISHTLTDLAKARLRGCINSAIQAAVLAEREACAAICQHKANGVWRDYQDAELSDDYESIASAIRARGTP